MISEYDAAGRLLTDQKVDGEGNILYSNVYVYDALGNRTSHTDLNGVTTSQYNGLNQLCMITGPDGSQVTYTYDGNGNRTAKSSGGNILQAYAYDFENHIVQASGPNGILGTYYYNADGLRAAKVMAAGTVGFIYDGEKLLQEVGATGQTAATYTSSGGNVYDPLVGIANAAGSHVPLMDGLGSVRLLLDSSQNASDGYAYEAFGRQVSGGGLTPNPYHFVGAYGYYQDWETGLTLLTFRYYDAEAGRFVTRDPIGFKGGELALYVYTTLPTLMIDPSGRAAGFAANGDDDLGPKCTLQKNNPSDVSCQDCGDEKLVAALIDKVKDLGKEFAKCVAGCVGKTGTELRNCVVECAGKSPKGPDLVISIRNYMLCEDTACLINPDWMAPGGCAKCLG